MYSPLSKILKEYKEGKIEHWETHDKILRLFNVVGQSEQYHCELYDFGRCEKPCEKQCEGCYWMDSLFNE